MKRTFHRNYRPSQDMVLNITSMADIFTILLVFLLKSLSTGATAISPSSEMLLPEVAKSDPLLENTRIEISSRAVLLDGKEILALNGFRPATGELQENGTSRSINEALKRQRERNTLQVSPRLMVMADTDAPYAIIKSVLISATTNGFEEFKLVVVENP